MGSTPSSPATDTPAPTEPDAAVGSATVTEAPNGYPASILTNLFHPQFVQFASARLIAQNEGFPGVKFALPPDYAFSDAFEDQVGQCG